MGLLLFMHAEIILRQICNFPRTTSPWMKMIGVYKIEIFQNHNYHIDQEVLYHNQQQTYIMQKKFSILVQLRSYNPLS